MLPVQDLQHVALDSTSNVRWRLRPFAGWRGPCCRCTGSGEVNWAHGGIVVAGTGIVVAGSVNPHLKIEMWGTRFWGWDEDVGHPPSGPMPKAERSRNSAAFGQQSYRIKSRAPSTFGKGTCDAWILVPGRAVIWGNSSMD